MRPAKHSGGAIAASNSLGHEHAGKMLAASSIAASLAVFFREASVSVFSGVKSPILLDDEDVSPPQPTNSANSKNNPERSRIIAFPIDEDCTAG